MYGLETTHAMNAQTPGELNARRVKVARQVIQNAQKKPGCLSASAVLEIVHQILRRRKFD